VNDLELFFTQAKIARFTRLLSVETWRSQIAALLDDERRKLSRALAFHQPAIASEPGNDVSSNK
jgi:hypothetical protein